MSKRERDEEDGGGGGGGQGETKRPRKQFAGPQKPHTKPGHQIPFGSSGLLCTFQEGKRNLAVREVLGIFEDYALADATSSGARLGSVNDGSHNDDDDDDDDADVDGAATTAQESLEAELRSLRKTGLSSTDVFRVCDVKGVKNHVYLQFLSEEARSRLHGEHAKVSEASSSSSSSASAESSATSAATTTTSSDAAASATLTCAESDTASGSAEDSSSSASTTHAAAATERVPNGVRVTEMARSVFSKLIQENVVRTRFAYRCIPVQLTCAAIEEHIVRALTPLIAKFFPRAVFSPIRFAVHVKVKCNASLSARRLTQTVAKLVPPVHVVDLRNPAVVILIVICQGVACMSILPEFGECREFNFNNVGDRRASDTDTQRPGRVGARVAADGGDEE